MKAGIGSMSCEGYALVLWGSARGKGRVRGHGLEDSEWHKVGASLGGWVGCRAPGAVGTRLWRAAYLGGDGETVDGAVIW